MTIPSLALGRFQGLNSQVTIGKDKRNHPIFDNEVQGQGNYN